MDRKVITGIMLTLLLTSMLTLAFNIYLVRAEITDRKVGVSVGYWIQYGISVMWESNDPNATTPQYVLDSQQLVFSSNVVQSVSGTNVTFSRIMLFKNGTEKSETRWIDVDSGHAGTGSASGYLAFIAANLSAGDIIYTGLGKGIGEINETITRTYLGEPVEINHHNSTTSGTSYFIYADAYWNRATGVLYEAYINHTEYTTKGEETYVTQETQWLYPIGMIGVAKTWTVDDDGPADFSIIQDAINAANPEDTIFVHSGTYYENVIVNKTVSLVGESRSTTVIDAKGKGTVVVVTAEAVNIQDFTVQNSGISLGDSGIVLSKSKSNTVKGNIISNNGVGIYTGLSNNNTFYHNVLVNNWEGIRFLLSSLNIVNGNVITNNHYGIHLVDSGDNVLRNNSMVENVYNFGVAGDELPHFVNDVDASNTVDGKAIYYLINKQHLVVKPSAFPDAGYLAVVNSTRITVQDFGLFNNFQGVLFAYTNNSKIENVNISDNFHGIMLFGSNNTLKGNNLTKNVYAIGSYGHSNLYFENVIADNNDGIWLIGSNNSIRRNIIANNNYRGIYLIGSNNTVFQNEIMNNSVGIVIDFYDNKIYHNNFINNVKQADLNEPRAIGIWDGGYPTGGNYWSDYAGVDSYGGPHQNETGSDGIGDTPYVIEENNQDNYPLMDPWILPAEPRTWTVDDDGPADFIKIQDAINAANPEDTIFVHSGTYYENVIVNKAVSLIGEDKLTTTIDGNMTGTVVMVTSDNVTISGFNIRNGGDIYAGISLSSNGNKITSNIMSNNWCGISLEHYSAYNVIADNSIMNNLNGIIGELWSETTIINNVLKDNLLGINTNYCDRNTIAFNNITNHWSQGIMIQFSSYNTIVGNYITDNNLGGFQEGGIYIGYSSYNKFFHNNIIANRVKQVEVRESGGHPSVNTWDDGYPSGGNYWGDYRDRYPNAKEIDDSGIWNTPYVIDENNQDNYPLMKPWSLKPSSPVEATQELIETIETWNISKGVENCLTSKLDNAIHQLDKGNEKGASHKLTVFINKVEVLRGKKLTNEQTDYLIAEAQRIIDLIEGLSS